MVPVITRIRSDKLLSLLAVVSLVTSGAGTILPAAQAAPTVYYVSPSGSDNNNGLSLGTSFRTIQKCANVVAAGDTCLIRGGTYRETVVVPTSGAAGNPIIFKNYDNESVTISGADVIPSTSWSLYSSNIYRAPMNWSLNVRTSSPNNQVTNNQVFVDGQMMVEARWPNIAVEKVTQLKNTDNAQATSANVANSYTATYMDPHLSAFPGNYWRGAKINFAPGWNTEYTTCDVTTSTTNSVSFQCNSDPGANNDRTSWEMPPNSDLVRPSAGNYYYLWGKLAALDFPGEWFRDGSTNSGTLYLWTPDNSRPSTHTVEAKRRLWAFDLRGKSYITLDGLKFFAAALRVGQYSNLAHHLLIQNIEARYLWHFQEIPPLWSLKGIYGLDLGGNDNVLRDSYLAYSAGPMVRPLGQRNAVFNNVIRDGAYMANAAVVSSNPSDTANAGGANKNILRQNTIFNGGNILVSAGPGMDIVYNDLYYSHLQISDLGTIYSWHTDGKGAEIAYNLVHDNWAELNRDLKYWGGYGIYLDYDTGNFAVHHNVVWNNSANGLYANGADVSKYPTGSNRKFYNNTVDGRIGSHAQQVDGRNQALIGTEFKNNYATASDLTDSNLILQSNRMDYRLVVKQRGQDYSLRHDSPVIDVGTALPGYTDGYLGAAPDIGAYEFGRPPFISGAVLRSQDLTGLTVACAANVGNTAACTISGLPTGRKLPPDFQIRVGTTGAPAQNCVTRMNYATHSGTGICEGVSTAGLSGIQAVYVKLGAGNWQNSGATVDLGPLAITAIIPQTGLDAGGVQVTLVGRRFDTAYSGYRVPITVTNVSGSSLYNYQVLVTLNTADWIAQGKLRTDCGDLRFNDAYGNLDYWLEDGCNTAHTRVWVHVPVVPTGSSQITMTYGTPGRASASDGRRAFVFFDDFNDGVVDLSAWSIGSMPGATISESACTMRVFGKTSADNRYETWGFDLNIYRILFPASFAVDTVLSVVPPSTSTSFKAAIGSGDLSLFGGGVFKDIGFWQSGVGWTNLGKSTLHTATFTGQKLSIAYTGPTSNRTVHWFENGDLTTSRAARSGVNTSSIGFFYYGPDAVASFDARFDNVRIRNYTYPEPTITLGAEVASGARVTLDGRPCASVSVVNGTKLTCAIPAHPAGVVEVAITNPDGQSFRLPSSFTYRKAPWRIYLPVVSANQTCVP